MTLGLLVVAVVPWLAPVFDSIELAGVGKFEFREFQTAVNRQVDKIAQDVRKVESLIVSGATPEQKRFLDETVADFTTYLRSLSIPVGPPPKVRLQKIGPNAYYETAAERITVDPSLVGERDVILREYARHLLAKVRGESFSDFSPSARGIESGLADYFSCSFSDDPVLGERMALIYYETIRKPYIRNLENEKTFGSVSSEEHAVGEVWGGAFWDVRDLLGRRQADALLIRAWRSTPSLAGQNASAAFARALVTAVKADAGATKAAEAARLIRTRGVRVRLASAVRRP